MGLLPLAILFESLIKMATGMDNRVKENEVASDLVEIDVEIKERQSASSRPPPCTSHEIIRYQK